MKGSIQGHWGFQGSWRLGCISFTHKAHFQSPPPSSTSAPAVPLRSDAFTSCQKPKNPSPQCCFSFLATKLFALLLKEKSYISELQFGLSSIFSNLSGLLNPRCWLRVQLGESEAEPTAWEEGSGFKAAPDRQQKHTVPHLASQFNVLFSLSVGWCWDYPRPTALWWNNKDGRLNLWRKS